MNTIRSLIVLAILCGTANASPGAFNHSGRLLDITGTPLSGSHQVTVTLYNASGNAVWQGVFGDVTFADGMYSVAIDTDAGGRTVLDAMHAQEPAVTLGIAIDGGAEFTPRSPLAAVPYATIGGGFAISDGATGTPCAGEGRAVVDRTQPAIAVCIAGVWTAVGGAMECRDAEVQDGGCRLPTSCRELREEDDSLASGVYSLDVDGSGGSAPFDAICDMDSFGGGWTQVVKNAPANNNPVWNVITGYNAPHEPSHISPAWHLLTDFTEVMDNQSGQQGGDISGCWSGESMATQTAKPTFTCTPSAISGMPHRTSLQFNTRTTHQGCTNLTANVAFGFTTWDGGVSGSWVALATNGYKTNTTVNCSTTCLKYSNSCLQGTYTGANGSRSFWVR